MLLLIVFLFTFLFIYILVDRVLSKIKKLPPGPLRLPIWGSYWLMLAGNYKFPHLAVDRIAKYYKTKILGFYLGPYYTVTTLDFETTHEMLTRPEFEGRIDTFITRLRAFEKRLGIFFTDGYFWNEQRRFSLRHMRDFGFGRRSQIFEGIVAEEINHVIKSIKEGGNNSFDKKIYTGKNICVMPDIFYSGFLNAFWFILTGERFDDNDTRKESIINAVLKFQRSGDPTGGALTMTPWLRYFIPNLSGYKPVKESNKVLQNIVMEKLKERSKHFSEDADNDFLDRYMNILKQQNEEEQFSFSEEQLILIMVDFIIPSVAANTAILGFIFTHLLHNPLVQKKIQNEIDKVVGTGRLPTLDDRSKMPYTEATIREGLRRESLNPFGIPRVSIVNTTLGGYFIPKGTMMLPGLWSVHMDEDLWKDPFNFRPDRFLDENGKLLKKDLTLPFGGGKRLCAGETFSRQNMFLFLSTYKISLLKYLMEKPYQI